MVADIQLLQGKIIEDPEKRTKNVSRLIEELALEIMSEADLAQAAPPQNLLSAVVSRGNS